MTEEAYMSEPACRACGTVWRTLWHADGWPVDRKVEPVTPEQAERNKAALGESLKPRSAA